MIYLKNFKLFGEDGGRGESEWRDNWNLVREDKELVLY